MNYYFYVMIFLIPYLVVSPLQKVMGIPTGIVYVGIVLVFTALLLLERPGRINCKKIFRTQLLIPLVIFFAVSGISVLKVVAVQGLAGLTSNNLKELGFLGFAILFYWAVTEYTDNREKLSGAINAFVAGAVFACTYGLIRLFLHMLGSEYGMAQAWTVPRLIATAGESQVFGGFIISVLPLVVGALLFRLKLFKGYVDHIIVGVLLLSLIATFSAGAWAGFVVAVIFLVTWIKYLDLKAILTTTLVTCLTFSGLFIIDKTVYPNYLEGFNSIVYKITGHIPAAKQFSGKETFEVLKKESPKNLTPQEQKYTESVFSKVERSWFREALWNMYKSSPVIGVGTGNFENLYNEFRPPGTPKTPYTPKPHNQYLEILAETGLVGMMSFAAVIISLLWLVLKGWPHLSVSDRKLLIALLACLLAVGIHGYAFGILVHLQLWLLLAFTVTVLRVAGIDRDIVTGIRGGSL